MYIGVERISYSPGLEFPILLPPLPYECWVTSGNHHTFPIQKEETFKINCSHHYTFILDLENHPSHKATSERQWLKSLDLILLSPSSIKLLSINNLQPCPKVAQEVFTWCACHAEDDPVIPLPKMLGKYST